MTQSGNNNRRDDKWDMRRVQDSRQFFNKVAIWLFMSVFFVYLNITSNAGFPWAAFPIFFWGLSLFKKGAVLFGRDSIFYKTYQDHKDENEQNSVLDLPNQDGLDLSTREKAPAEMKQKGWNDKDLV